MGSRREEERNEKIIRGLMKLPPNRMCINCNSLGPQYVCTNFWTFVCVNCSGIHREFTHRVKSVSMSKFTSQEVEALQNGGNQRAREAYLTSWDIQRQRFPNSSDADKIREFIKSVYVDKKYAGGKILDKPPRDTQSIKDHGDDFRRASSYHSFSQSPPYDYQYEDRRYGKQAPVLTRRPGSDRGYLGKISSFVYSPDRLSDYSVSSGGDPFRSGTESPNFQKDIGFGSPTMTQSRDASSADTQTQNIDLFADSNLKRDVEACPHHQRSSSLRSVGSIDSNSISVRSSSSGHVLDIVPEVNQTAGTCKDKLSASQASGPANYGGLDLFNLPEASTSPANDLFQSPAASFEPASIVPVLTTELPLQAQYTASVDLFAGITEQPSGTILDNKLQNSAPKDEGWATFDTPPGSSESGHNKLTIASRSSEGSDQFVPFNLCGQWPSGVDSNAAGPVSSISSSWNQGFLDSEVPPAAMNPLLWSAFDGSAGQSSLELTSESIELQVPIYKPSEAPGQQVGLGVVEDMEYGNRKGAFLADHSGPSLQPVVHMEASHPLTEERHSQVANHKSSNPFDLPYGSDLDETNLFLDMTSLEFALPNNTLQSPFLAGVSPQYPGPVTSFIPSAPQGGLAYITGTAPSSQLPSVQAQGPVTSIGGNPFA